MMRTAFSSLAICAWALALAAAAPAFAQNQTPPQPPRAQRPAQPAKPQAQPATPPAQTQQPQQDASAPKEADEDAAPASQPSQQVKCDAYRKAFDAVVARVGRKGLSDEFIGRNAAFVEASCAGERNVCPRSPEELRVANIIVAQAVSSTGGTFMPFGCPKQP
ncbi:MAG: hypothetical protein BGP06_07335 [Rhizobiales bacterium 65-9]|nr:hypothetical protein [Hyphomicrobiales bacterium]OJY35625.1 MAG: hypothetical protein BGP06_07335 [Rhizobiales bacterium 65-9]